MQLHVGMVLPEALSSADLAHQATSAEDAGLHSVWFTEIGRESLVRASFAAAATSRIRVGTAVCLWNRTPVTAATATAELNQLSGGRFTYGLGCGTQWHNENWHDTAWNKPTGRMGEYITIVRGVWAADRTVASDFSFSGEHFTVKNYRQSVYDQPPPLHLAAVGPAMMRLAGKRADGVIFNPASTPWSCRQFGLPQVAAGAKDAGRLPVDIARSAVIRCAVNDDVSLARHWVRRDIAQYGQYPTHQLTYERHGFQVEARAIADAMLAGDQLSATQAVSEEMVDTFGVAGTPNDVRRGLGRWTDVIDVAILMPGLAGMTLDEVVANVAAVRDAFGT